MAAINNNPLVSIITPVRNGMQYLEICIQSVLFQSYPNIEHIFVDGVSSDGTLVILNKYQAMYPERIRFISEPDKSAGEAWNKGLKMAKGDILGWLGSDDLFEPDAIKTVVDFFYSNPDAYFLFGDCAYIDEEGKIIGTPLTRDFSLDEVINDACYIPCPSSFYRKEVIEKVGYLDTREIGCDLDYWIRIGKVFKIYRIKKTLSRFRDHKKSVSGAKEASRMYAREGYIISRRYGGRFFSGYAIRYFGTDIIEGLRPVIGRYYPFIYRRIISPFVIFIGNISSDKFPKDNKNKND